MSTRCNIIIQYDESKVYLYRHHDGYLSETGADLAEKFAACKGSTDQFLRSLLDQRHEKASYETEPRAVYELTSDIHGDIEYLYRVRFPPRSGEAEIGYVARRNFEDFSTGWTRSTVMGPLGSFVESVNSAIRQANIRLEMLQKGENGKFWSAHEPQAELNIAKEVAA